MGNFQNWLAQNRGTTKLPTLEATAKLAESLARVLPDDWTLALSGDLGSGKTTFVRFFANALGIDEPVKSPTFNLYNIYDGAVRLIHCDAYRLKSGLEMDALLLDEFLVSPWFVCVEWPENVGDWMPENSLHLTFAIVNGIHQVTVDDGVNSEFKNQCSN